MDERADLVLTGGVVWTGRAEQPFAEALAVRGGRIVAVGSVAAVRDRVHSAREVVELAGKAVLPGFQDAHCHPSGGGLQMRSCDMGAALTLAECQEAVRSFLDRRPDASWVTGKGWSMASFPGGTPDASGLDAVCGGRPAFVVNQDGHSAWVSSRALELAGIDSTTADPPHGRIERDGLGRPQGTLHEGAMDLVGRLVPRVADGELADALADAQTHLFALGITAWQDAAVEVAVQKAYTDLAGSGRLRARTRLALWWDRERGLEQIPDLVARRAAAADAGLVASTVKMMLDGVVETFTAAMLEPYTDSCAGGCRHEPGSGQLFLEPDLAVEAVRLLANEGFQVHFHAIGDRAVRLALDAVERSGGAAGPGHGGAADLRHHVAHVQVVHPDDVARFHRLGVAVNAQPFWACIEPQMTDLTLPFLGEVRSRWQYPFASLADSGAVLAGGSDWPVSTANPLEEIAVAVARTLPASVRRGADAEAPFLVGERLALAEALRAFTSGSAFVNHLERETGTLEEGKLADLVVLARDPFTTGAENLPEARVLLTTVGGDVVFDAGQV